ncbi:MAG TPA: RDD family protein [Mycobacteriales bacterium]|nr:RDD family protein [Mycobacteriales bacterium]
MPRWTGTWLSGLAAAGVQTGEPGAYKGSRLGLPEGGSGSVAGFGARLGGFVLDVITGALIGGLANLFVAEPTSGQRTLFANTGFALEVLVLVALTGQSIGMRLVGIRVLSLRAPASVPGFLPAAIRTALLALLVPALLMDRDGRGLHDKAARTVVVRA